MRIGLVLGCIGLVGCVADPAGYTGLPYGPGPAYYGAPPPVSGGPVYPGGYGTVGNGSPGYEAGPYAVQGYGPGAVVVVPQGGPYPGGPGFGRERFERQRFERERLEQERRGVAGIPQPRPGLERPGFGPRGGEARPPGPMAQPMPGRPDAARAAAAPPARAQPPAGPHPRRPDERG